jgi:predicted HD superfamily hydrolase involved in NAD metabolism
MLKLAREFGIVMDEIQKRYISILHAPVGAKIAKKEFGVEDEEILTAICYHTTGCQNMSIMSKVIYVADYIAQGRHFEGIEEIRKIAFNDLDAAVLIGMDLTIKYVISLNGLLHPDTIDARNDMLMKRKECIDYEKGEEGLE